MSYTRINPKVTLEVRTVTTEANSYVAPWGAYKEITGLSNVAAATCWSASTNPASVCVTSDGERLQVYSKSPATVYVRVLYMPS